MSESTIILLGLLAISCPISALLGALVIAVILRAWPTNGNGRHQRTRTVPLYGIPKGQLYHTVKRWVEDGWDYQATESESVGKYDIILSKYI